MDFHINLTKKNVVRTEGRKNKAKCIKRIKNIVDFNHKDENIMHKIGEKGCQ